MPRIAQYEAPSTKISESNEGYSAWETAGRRIGPLLNQAAQDATKEGALQADAIKQSAWPLRFLALAQQPKTVGFKIVGGVNKPWAQQNTTLGQVGAGAANIGDVMADATGDGNPDQQTVGPGYGPTTGGNLPPIDPWGNSGLAKTGGSPNASAIASANSWYGQQPATPAPGSDSGGGAVARVGAAIAGVMGGGDDGSASSDGSAVPPGMV